MYKDNGIQGWMSGGEQQWLYTQAKKMKSIVEIGSWKGRSTHALCSGTKGTVYAVDTWKGSRAELTSSHREATERDIFVDFKQNLAGFRNLNPIRMPSTEAHTLFQAKSVDMIFIDGSHLYEDVLADITLWLPKCRRLICGHDAGQDGVPRAVEESFGKTKCCESIWYVWLDGTVDKTDV